MKAILNHIALNVENIEEVEKFFKEIFDMEIEKTKGEKPKRQIWFKEGIQLNECEINDYIKNKNDFAYLDHIGIEVDDLEKVIEKSKKYGCEILDKGPNWIKTKFDLVIELKNI